MARRCASRLAREGYLFIRGLIPAEAIHDGSPRAARQSRRRRLARPRKPVEAGIANMAAACKDPEERYMQVFRGLWSDEELHRLRTHPRAIALFSSIFGEPALAHPMFVQRNIFPQSGSFDFTTGVHQDRVHIGGATSYAMWMPLGDCPREKGALAVAAGSHKHGILETRVGTGAGGMDISVPIPGAWVTGAFQAGDALIFQDLTVHKALPNRTREISHVVRRPLPAREPAGRRHRHGPLLGLRYVGGGLCRLAAAAGAILLEGPEARSPSRSTAATTSGATPRPSRWPSAATGPPRDAILRIVQRDKSAEKRARAQQLLDRLDAQ